MTSITVTPSNITNLIQVAEDPISMDTNIPESMFDSRLYSIGICVLDKKAQSLPMQAILSRFPRSIFQILYFGNDTILHKPIEEWPKCDILIAFHSTGFPLLKAQEYINLHQPIIVNDVAKQALLLDRRQVYRVLQQHNIPVPFHIIIDRDPSNHTKMQEILEFEDSIQVNGSVITKPFVEKPVDGEDHNIFIYYPMSAGGGCKKLFRKIGNRSSIFDPNCNTIRRDSSYIYEEFLSTQGTDVKVYTVGPNYAHAEARKSPVLDGRVLRDEDGKEVRYPVMLEAYEKEIARKVCLAFGQTICGFDILRLPRQSYVCDVNGWSFVKNSEQYYDDCATLLVKFLESALLMQRLPNFQFPLSVFPESLPVKSEETVLLNDETVLLKEEKEEEELRCVLAIIRHGDRTPKQKMKMMVCHPLFLSFYEKKQKGNRDLKIKSVSDLEELIEISKRLIDEYSRKENAFLCFLREREELYNENPTDRMQGYRTLLHVLQRWKLHGINRKVQLKRMESNESDKRVGKLLLILKWGGDLTHSGAEQAEALGHEFRQVLYPGGKNGLIRLHSTYRHDLKIYTSDEGRVQKTAAMFAKGFLGLEGDIVPILVGLVLKSKDATQMLDQSGSSVQETIMRVKQRLHWIIHRGDNCKELVQHSSSQLLRSVARALIAVDQPVKKMEIMHQLLSKFREQLTKLIQEKSVSQALDGKEKKEVNASARATMERGRSLSDTSEHRTRHLHVSGEERELETHCKIPEPCGRETLEMMRERWAKLYRDFYNRKLNTFDLSKIPDIHDCIRYDALHNSHLCLKGARECLDIASSLAHALVPQEYGINLDEKIQIGSAMCRTLLKKIVDDLDLARGIHSLSTHRLNPTYAKDKHEIKSKFRSVRTRLYFTSESHLHSLLNVLRYSRDNCAIPSPIRKEAMKSIEEIPELCYMSHFVVRVFERFQYSIDDRNRFRVEISLSSGASSDPLDDTFEKHLKMDPLKLISREGMTCQDLVDYLEDSIAFAEKGEAAFVAQSKNDCPEKNKMLAEESKRKSERAEVLVS